MAVTGKEILLSLDLHMRLREGFDIIGKIEEGVIYETEAFCRSEFGYRIRTPE
jgi:hypothetical protein